MRRREHAGHIEKAKKVVRGLLERPRGKGKRNIALLFHFFFRNFSVSLRARNITNSYVSCCGPNFSPTFDLNTSYYFYWYCFFSLLRQSLTLSRDGLVRGTASRLFTGSSG